MAEVNEILCPICHKSNLRRARFCQHCGHDIILNNDNPSHDDPRRYFITKVIKEGGQGAVYMAIDNDGKVYALKEMLDRFTDPREREEAIERFDEEAELLLKLKHPRIPVVYSHFKDEGRHYLTMDYIEGEDLDDVLDRQISLPEDEVLELADQICDVLDYLHRSGLIYRDMKPSNIMMDRKNGGIKLVDFGIAKLFNPANRGGTQIGTPGYAPPEQYQGLATPSSDIYALGATLHHMLTGRDPTDNAPFSFPPVRSINPKISQNTSDVLDRALQMKPEDRWDSVAEMRDALRRRPTGATTSPGATVNLPSRPSASSTATPAPPVATRPATQSTPAVQAARPAAPAAQATAVPAPQQTAPRRSRGVGCWVVMLLLVALIGGGIYAYVAYPSLVQPIITAVEGLMPQESTAVPTTAPLVSRLYQTQVEISLPATATDQEIRTRLQEAYAEKARSELGATAVVSQSFPPTPVGGIEKVGDESNGQITYRATMSGQVAAPQ